MLAELFHSSFRMRSRFAIIALFLPATVLSQQASTVPIEAAVRRLEERWRLAQQQNDTTAFGELLAPDLTFVGTSGALRAP